MMITPIRYGWSVQLSDGRELARFLGPGARWRATRYLKRAAEALSKTRLALVVKPPGLTT